MNKLSLVSAVVFSITGIHLISMGDHRGWIVISFFGICSVIATIPLLPKRWFARISSDSLLGRLYGKKEIPDPKYGIMHSDAEGLRHVLRGGEMIFVSWNRVNRITACKIDLWSVDCIRVVFEGEFAESPYQVHELTHGFGKMIETIQVRFPVLADDWQSFLMAPAFQTNETVLFERSKADNAPC